MNHPQHPGARCSAIRASVALSFTRPDIDSPEALQLREGLQDTIAYFETLLAKDFA